MPEEKVTIEDEDPGRESPLGSIVSYYRIPHFTPGILITYISPLWTYLL